MTRLQPLASANAPWTRTMAGLGGWATAGDARIRRIITSRFIWPPRPVLADTTALEDAHEGFGSPAIAVRVGRLRLDHPALVVEVVWHVRLRLLLLRPQLSGGGEGSPCGLDDAPPGARRLGCRERLPPESSPLFLLRAHDRETTTTRWPEDPSLPLRLTWVHGIGQAVPVNQFARPSESQPDLR